MAMKLYQHARVAAMCVAAGAAIGFGTGGLMYESTDAHRAVISERETLMQLPSVQVYNKMVSYTGKRGDDYVTLKISELTQNPEPLQQLEEIVKDPAVVRYVQLRDEPTEQFSTKHSIYGVLAGGALIGGALLGLIYRWVLKADRNQRRTAESA